MVIHNMLVKPGQQPTEGQKQRILKAAERPIVYDEDSPELTEEQYREFAIVAARQRKARKKQIISLRISPETLAKAKLLGRGYTSVLSRLLDLAIDNPDMVKKCL